MAWPDSHQIIWKMAPTKIPCKSCGRCECVIPCRFEWKTSTYKPRWNHREKVAQQNLKRRMGKWHRIKSLSIHEDNVILQIPIRSYEAKASVRVCERMVILHMKQWRFSHVRLEPSMSQNTTVLVFFGSPTIILAIAQWEYWRDIWRHVLLMIVLRSNCP